jgi:hypothetical protein
LVRVQPGVPLNIVLQENLLFQNINKYILLDKSERQIHIDLKSVCVEIGTNSQQCRALLAYFLGTNIPRGMMIHLCHACANANCSNPKHLYWGTAKENQQDCGFQELGVKATKGKTWNHSEETKEKMRKVKIGKPSNNVKGINKST